MAEVYVYDYIDAPGFGISAQDFVAEIKALNSPRVNLRLNSPGGDVFEGQTIYNAIRRHPAEWTAYVDGVAASIASVVALAADKVIMASNAMMMIHNPWALVAGSADEMRQTADVLDKVRSTLVGVYAEKTGQDADAIEAAMSAETWFTAEEAVDFGLADEMGAELAIAAADVSGLNYRHVPAILAKQPHPLEPSAADDERLEQDLDAIAARAKEEAEARRLLTTIDLDLAVLEPWEADERMESK